MCCDMGWCSASSTSSRCSTFIVSKLYRVETEAVWFKLRYI